MWHFSSRLNKRKRLHIFFTFNLEIFIALSYNESMNKNLTTKLTKGLITLAAFLPKCAGTFVLPAPITGDVYQCSKAASVDSEYAFEINYICDYLINSGMKEVTFTYKESDFDKFELRYLRGAVAQLNFLFSAFNRDYKFELKAYDENNKPKNEIMANEYFLNAVVCVDILEREVQILYNKFHKKELSEEQLKELFQRFSNFKDVTKRLDAISWSGNWQDVYEQLTTRFSLNLVPFSNETIYSGLDFTSRDKMTRIALIHEISQNRVHYIHENTKMECLETSCDSIVNASEYFKVLPDGRIIARDEKNIIMIKINGFYEEGLIASIESSSEPIFTKEEAARIAEEFKDRFALHEHTVSDYSYYATSASWLDNVYENAPICGAPPREEYMKVGVREEVIMPKKQKFEIVLGEE